MIFLEVVPAKSSGSLTGGRATRLSKKFRLLPRIGESVYIVDGIFLKVADIRYMGVARNIIEIHYEAMELSNLILSQMNATISVRGYGAWNWNQDPFDE